MNDERRGPLSGALRNAGGYFTKEKALRHTIHRAFSMYYRADTRARARALLFGPVQVVLQASCPERCCGTHSTSGVHDLQVLAQ